MEVNKPFEQPGPHTSPEFEYDKFLNQTHRVIPYKASKLRLNKKM